MVLMKLTFPISYPIAWVLDRVLGEHKSLRYNASQLSAIITMHASKALDEMKGEIETNEVGTNRRIGLNRTQQKLIQGALNWKHEKAKDIYKDAQRVYMLRSNTVVDDELIAEIKNKNFSRIPIYYGEPDRRLVFCILMTKSLIGVKVDPKNE